MSTLLHPSADTTAVLPESGMARLDRAARAVQALEGEQVRLSRLGLELPLARCGEQLRYWRFVHAVLRVAAGETR